MTVSEGFEALTSPRRSLHGLSVSIHNASEAESLFGKIDGALALIDRLDPRRYQRLRHDLRRISVVPAKGNWAAYSPFTKACYLKEAVAVGYDAPVIALVLVHEAVHARLARAGLSNWPDRRQRTEALCYRQEMAFARLLERAGAKGVEPWLRYLDAEARDCAPAPAAVVRS